MRTIQATQVTVHHGEPDRYRGEVRSRALLGRSDGLSARVYDVAFEPDSRTAWHVHTGVQLLVVTEGVCVACVRGGEPRRAGVGDVIVVEPGEEHWHGATAEGPMRHLAINLGAFETHWSGPSG